MILAMKLFFVGGAATWLLWIAWQFRMATRSRTWPSVGGRVTSGEVGSTTNEGGLSVYRAKVRYEYEVFGRTFTGKRLFFGDDAGWFQKAVAQDRVERYAVGTPVQVFYDPKSPARSALEPGIDAELWKGLAVAVAVGAVAAWLVLSAKWVA
jgi:hypothetical protein